MIKMRTKKDSWISKRLFTFSLFVFILVACESKEKGLPYIGHHDIAQEDTEQYAKGDTMYHEIPEFTYLTQDSVLMNSSEIEGKVWIAKFFFTTCPTICPPMTASMKEVHSQLKDQWDELVFLSFSIDPEKDTPAQLRNYIELHDIDPVNWYFLTGDEEETHDLGVNGFFIHAMSDDLAPGGFAHSPNFVLVDQNKHIRGIYDGLVPEQRAQLIQDVHRLLKQ
jgi:protein SCO1/2